MPNPERKPRNIVVCCDGTGNEFCDSNSNVVKLYTCLIVDSDQLVYYHPGVGTMGDPASTSWLGKKATRIAGLAFGWGFRSNLADAYTFLMRNYADGDRIFLFGFSRGAYTVRALAGALFMYGLLCPGNEGHLPYLLGMFSDESRTAYNRKYDRKEPKKLKETDISRAFRDTFSRVVPIHFIGVWDTVSSIGWIYDPVKLLYDGQNPVVSKGRHAVSVGERRCFFQDNLWGAPLTPDETPVLAHLPNPADRQQDIVQAWFAGVHSDVGGSYPQAESGPAMEAFSWMLKEAESAGLCIQEEKREAVFGRPSQHPDILKINKPAETPAYRLHSSLTWKWWVLEVFPHKYFDERGEVHYRFIPWPHRRELPDGALIHPTLWKRLRTPELNYRPPNLKLANVKSYSESPVPLPQPRVMDQLRDGGFGVYRKSGAPVRSQTPIVAAAMFCIGLATYLLRRT